MAEFIGRDLWGITGLFYLALRDFEDVLNWSERRIDQRYYSF